MTLRAARIQLRRFLRNSSAAQIGLIMLVWLAGQLAVWLTGIPLSGGVVGLAFLLALLASGRVSRFSLRRGSSWFLAEMILFFMPATLAVLNHPEMLGLLGVKIMIVILAGTAAVMISSALTVELCFRWRTHHAACTNADRFDACGMSSDSVA
ncbi:CidA/LrgA family protein [Methyloligella solikamskensis]|uniref:CidA/LrgA family protein n=1 Tax=Methyloligella solikamskensis TaxID=1177756 RepID=A0ABW3JAS9_9HYPH